MTNLTDICLVLLFNIACYEIVGMVDEKGDGDFVQSVSIKIKIIEILVPCR
ncbi:hypothetical protein [Neobacillus thermocopriae]|uniref:hypothetical protein n=1 Tax=Neobacillus thermocopriae TaxID=1215031 RepID=UPI0037703CE3